jgi:hypothetical protein
MPSAQVFLDLNEKNAAGTGARPDKTKTGLESGLEGLELPT